MRQSSNLTGIPSSYGKISFHPYYKVKDHLVALFLLTVILILVIVSSDLLGDPESYTLANPFNTPTSHQAEIILVFAYAVL